MASITPRKNKKGKIISYRIRVARGYDGRGNKIKPYEMTYKPEPDMTRRQIDKELQRQATLFEESCKNGDISSATNVKLRDFCKSYLELQDGVLSPRTHEHYANVIERLIIPALGHMQVSEIRPAHVQQFIKVIKNSNKRPLSPSTIRRHLAILQSILHQAVKLEIIPTNPATLSKLTLPKLITPKIDIFTKQEAAAMLSCLDNEPLQFKAIVYLAIISGARLGELVGLKFSDVNFVTNKITIERSVYKLKDQPIQTKPPKDNDIRTVSVAPFCIDLIRQLQEEKENEALRLGTAWHGEDWLFTKWDGSVMHPQTPSHWFREFLKRNGLKHRKFHSLRHTSATLLLLGGINIKQVSGRLGHADLRVTNQYLHCLAEADETAANVLQQMLITERKASETIEASSDSRTG